MCVRAGLTVRTGTTILHRTFDFDDRVASSILDGRPTAPGVACWTGGTLLLPIEGKLASLKACAFLGLPVIILSGRAKESDSIVLSAPEQCVSISIAGVYNMRLWQDLLSRQGFMNARHGITIGLRGRRSFTMGHQVRSVLITGSRHMHFVANPTGFSLLGIQGLRIIGRVHHCARRRSIAQFTPAQFALFPLKMLHPDVSQRLNRRYLAYPARSRLCIDRTQQACSIVSANHGRRFASLLAIGKTIIFNAVFVALDPRLLPLSLQPRRGSHRQTIQSGSKGFSHEFHTIERTDLRQHMRGVGALLAACFEVSMLTYFRQKPITEQTLLCVRKQALPKFDQHTGIKARIVHVQPQQIFPLQPTTHGIGGLSVGYSFAKLHHTDQCSPPRGLGWLTASRIQVHEVFICRDAAKLIAQLQGDMALWKGCTSNTSRLFWYRANSLGLE
jgi:hypothetical protein